MDVSKSAVVANNKPVALVMKHIEKDFGDLAGKHVALWGLSFKPKTDDVREAPAFNLIKALLAAGATVAGSDPEAMTTAKICLEHDGITDGVRLCEDPYDAVNGADALVLCTEWRQYNSPNVEKLKGAMRGRRVYDGRNVWIPAEFREAGFDYIGIGKR